MIIVEANAGGGKQKGSLQWHIVPLEVANLAASFVF